MSLREHSWRKLHSGDITYCLFPPFHFFFALPIRVKEKETLFGMKILKNYCGLDYFLYPSTWHQEKKYPIILCKYFKKMTIQCMEQIYLREEEDLNLGFAYFIDLPRWVFLAKHCTLDFSVQHNKLIALSDFCPHLDIYTCRVLYEC